MLTTIAKPFGVLLMWLYEFCGNYGLAVILFALIVKLILLPFQMKSKKSMMKTSRLQPLIKELEKKHGANKQKYNEEVAKLYKSEKVNPMSGCLWTLLPFPILLALYQAIRMPITIMMGVSAELLSEGGAIFEMLSKLGFTTNISATYQQIAQSQFIAEHFDSFVSISDKLRQIDYGFLGVNLGAQPQFSFLWSTDWSNPSVWGPGLALFIIPILSGVITFLSTRISTKMNAGSGQQQQPGSGMMNIIMPLFTIYIAFVMPAALGIYWIASSLFGMIQDIILTKHYNTQMDADDAIRLETERLKEAELEAKRAETEKLKQENRTVANPSTSKKKQQKVEKQQKAEKSVEWEKKTKGIVEEENPSGVGERRYARGRAYNPDRFNDDGEPVDSESEISSASDSDTSAEIPAAVTQDAADSYEDHIDDSDYDEDSEYYEDQDDNQFDDANEED